MIGSGSGKTPSTWKHLFQNHVLNGSASLLSLICSIGAKIPETKEQKTKKDFAGLTPGHDIF